MKITLASMQIARKNLGSEQLKALDAFLAARGVAGRQSKTELGIISWLLSWGKKYIEVRGVALELALEEYKEVGFPAGAKRIYQDLKLKFEPMAQKRITAAYIATLSTDPHRNSYSPEPQRETEGVRHEEFEEVGIDPASQGY